MGEEGPPESVCGYEYDPEWLDGGESQQSCCIRETLSDADRCIWHSEPDETDEKSVKALREARISSKNYEYLDGAELSGMNFGDETFLENTSLRDSNISSANLWNSSLSDTDLRGANLSRTDLRKADLSNTLAGGANLSESNFRDADLLGASLHSADLSDATLRGADLSDATFQDTNLSGARLVGANLSDADFRSANLSNVFFYDANLSGADFSDANLSNAVFWDANLSDAYLWSAHLSKANLEDANLSNADLHNADLSGKRLYGVDLSGADLKDANISDAKLNGSNLSGANLDGANIVGADLENTNLAQTSLEQSNSIRANLINANLQETELQGALLRDIRMDRNTKFGGHYADELDGGTSEDFDKAAWSLRQIQRLFEENAFPEKAREAKVERKDLRRRENWAKAPIPSPIQSVVAAEKHAVGKVKRGAKRLVSGSEDEEDDHDAPEIDRPLNVDEKGGFSALRSWAWLAVSGFISRYAESPRRVVGVSLLTIVAFGFAYPFFGGMETSASSGTQYAFYTTTFTLPGWAEELFYNLYFSAVTFTTLGYGDIQPATPATQTLASIQSFFGALLMALLVYVFGRRSTR